VNHSVQNYDVVIIPEFNVKNMVKRDRRKINSPGHIMHSGSEAEETDAMVIIQDEAYTSKTCSYCGNIQNISSINAETVIRLWTGT